MIENRAGFESPVPDYAPNIARLKLIDLDWRALSTADMQRARADWQGIFAG